jgi:hypothetical protein
MGIGLVRYELYRFKIRITTVTSIFGCRKSLMDWFSVRILLADRLLDVVAFERLLEF